MLPSVVAQNAALICLVADWDGDVAPTVSDLARSLKKDPENTRKTVKLLVDNGSLAFDEAKRVGITDGGRAQVPALRVVTGEREVDANQLLLTASKLMPHPLNPRTTFAPEEIEAIAETIAEQGLLQNLTVRAMKPPGLATSHWIVAGERRWRAIRLLIDRKDPRWPADRKIRCQLVDITDQEHLVLATIENVARVDLNKIEEAKNFAALEATGLKPSVIAKKIGKTPRHVQRRLQLLTCEQHIQDQVAKGDMSVEAALATVQEKKPDAGGAEGDGGGARLPLVEIAAKMLAEEGAGQILVAGRPAVLVDGYKATTDASTKQLTRQGYIRFETLPRDQGTVVVLTREAIDFLVLNGWKPSHANAQAQIAAARLAGDGIGSPARDRVARGEWATSWLNEPLFVNEPDETGEADEEDPAVFNGKRYGNATWAGEARRLSEGGGPSNSGSRPRAPHPDEATDNSISPAQALLMGEVLHKAHHWPHSLQGYSNETWTRIAVDAPKDLREQLRPLLWGGYVSLTTDGRGREYLKVNEAGRDYLKKQHNKHPATFDALSKLRGRIGALPERGCKYATPWLNCDEDAPVTDAAVDQHNPMSGGIGAALIGPADDDLPHSAAATAEGVGDEVLFVLRRGDIVSTGGASTYRILDLPESSGTRVIFRVQPILKGKDFGSPRALDLREIHGPAR